MNREDLVPSLCSNTMEIGKNSVSWDDYHRCRFSMAERG